MSSAPPESVEPSLLALGALLDRSVVQIAEAAGDARTFDRETIRAVSDMWDNNTFPCSVPRRADPPGRGNDVHERPWNGWRA